MNVKSDMQTQHVIRVLIGFALYLFFIPALLFISAGSINWLMAWVYVVLLLASTIGSRLIVLRKNPDTLRERARFVCSEGTKSWDRILVMLVGFFMDGFEGSIHQASSHLMAGNPCNGWEHWYYDGEDGELHPIDELRQVLRLRKGEF